MTDLPADRVQLGLTAVVDLVDGRFVASTPLMPGFKGYARTRWEAVAALAKELRDHVCGLEAPLTLVRGRPGSDDLAEAARELAEEFRGQLGTSHTGILGRQIAGLLARFVQAASPRPVEDTRCMRCRAERSQGDIDNYMVAYCTPCVTAANDAGSQEALERRDRARFLENGLEPSVFALAHIVARDWKPGPGGSEAVLRLAEAVVRVEESLTPAEAEAAYDAAEAVPVSAERIQEIVEYATCEDDRRPSPPAADLRRDLTRTRLKVQASNFCHPRCSDDFAEAFTGLELADDFKGRHVGRCFYCGVDLVTGEPEPVALIADAGGTATLVQLEDRLEITLSPPRSGGVMVSGGTLPEHLSPGTLVRGADGVLRPAGETQPCSSPFAEFECPGCHSAGAHKHGCEWAKTHGECRHRRKLSEACTPCAIEADHKCKNFAIGPEGSVCTYCFKPEGAANAQ